MTPLANTAAGWTKGPWFAHGFTYPEGVVGDVFAKDSGNVLACTPICRVVEPVSKMDGDLRRPPVDALQAIRRKAAAKPVIEANARLIAAAPELYEALAAIIADCGDTSMDGYVENSIHSDEVTKARAALAKALGK